ncbi:MAG: GNAT family N-acetyltransferase [Chloroflexota bacterium]
MAEGIVARGSKTVVRWFERADVDRRQQWPRHTDPLYSHNDPRPMSTRERDLWFLDRGVSGNYRMFAIDDAHGNMIGWITLRNINVEAGTSVLGIALDPTRMGMGYGTDALMAFLDYYFDDMGFREMWLDVAAFNHRAMRSYEKCGFRYVGQHWTEHPNSVFPPVFSDARYREVVQYFRRSLLGVEVLYYDMVIDRAAFRRRKAAMGAEARLERSREVNSAHRAARRR